MLKPFRLRPWPWKPAASGGAHSLPARTPDLHPLRGPVVRPRGRVRPLKGRYTRPTCALALTGCIPIDRTSPLVDPPPVAPGRKRRVAQASIGLLGAQTPRLSFSAGGEPPPPPAQVRVRPQDAFDLGYRRSFACSSAVLYVPRAGHITCSEETPSYELKEKASIPCRIEACRVSIRVEPLERLPPFEQVIARLPNGFSS